MGHSDEIFALAASPDGRLLASGGLDGKVCLWRIPERNLVWAMLAQEQVTSVAFSPDGQWLYTNGFGGRIARWEVSSGRRQRLLGNIFRLFGSSVHGLDVSADGLQLAAVTRNGTVELWRLDTNKRLRKHDDIHGVGFRICFNPTGQLVASGGNHGTVQLWPPNVHGEFVDPKEHSKLETPLSQVTAVRFSPSGKYFAAAGFQAKADTIGFVWNTWDWDEVCTFEGLSARDLRFSRDDKSLLIADANRSSKIIELPSGDVTVTFGSAYACAFFQGDRKLALAGNHDAGIRFYDLS